MNICEYINNLIETYFLNKIINKDITIDIINEEFPIIFIASINQASTFPILRKYKDEVIPMYLKIQTWYSTRIILYERCRTKVYDPKHIKIFFED